MRYLAAQFAVLLVVVLGLAACAGEPAQKKGKYKYDPTSAEWSARETLGP